MSAQIKRSDKFGHMLYLLSKTPSVKTIVEIGTYTGEGSTKCIIDGLLERSDNYKFITVELDKEIHKIAMSNMKKVIDKHQNIKSYNGRIIQYDDIFWFDHSTVFNDPSKKPVEIKHALKWYNLDLLNLKSSPYILDLIPEKIDLLILDGGEYTTYPEFKVLKDRTKIFALDDTTVLKCNKIRSELINDKLIMIYDDLNNRNGSSIFSRDIIHDITF